MKPFMLLLSSYHLCLSSVRDDGYWDVWGMHQFNFEYISIVDCQQQFIMIGDWDVGLCQKFGGLGREKWTRGHLW